jgi:hypothetical protein
MRRLIGGWLLVVVFAIPAFAVSTSGTGFLFGTTVANPAPPVVAQPSYGSSSVNTTSTFYGFNPTGSPAPYYGNTSSITTTQQTTSSGSAFLFGYTPQPVTPVITQPGMPTVNTGGSYVSTSQPTSGGAFLFGSYRSPVYVAPMDAPNDSGMPEPGTVVTMCGGMVILALLRRRMLQKK